MDIWYGPERASRLILGNEGADKLVEEGLHKNEVKAPPFTEFHSRMNLVTTRLKKTKQYPPITERFRATLKSIHRERRTKQAVKKGLDWINHPEITKHTFNLLKSKDIKLESHKKHFVRCLHKTLPTKQKIWKHKEQEHLNNNKHKAKGLTPLKFWEGKYKHITNNTCALCKSAPETIEHLHECKHPQVQAIQAKLQQKIENKLGASYVWFNTTHRATQHSTFNKHWGSIGLIPKAITKYCINKDKQPLTGKPLETFLISIQKSIIKASMKIWTLRNKKLFGNLPP